MKRVLTWLALPFLITFSIGSMSLLPSLMRASGLSCRESQWLGCGSFMIAAMAVALIAIVCLIASLEPSFQEKFLSSFSTRHLRGRLTSFGTSFALGAIAWALILAGRLSCAGAESFPCASDRVGALIYLIVSIGIGLRPLAWVIGFITDLLVKDVPDDVWRQP